MNSSGDDRLHERKLDITANPPVRKEAGDFEEEPPEGVAGKARLGSLAQQARGKQLNTARWILLVIGVLTVILNLIPLFDFTQGKFQTPRELLEKEIRKQVGPGQVIDPVKLKPILDHGTVILSLILGAFIFLGVLYIIFGIIIKRFPVPVTILSLVLYILAMVAQGLLDATTLVQGFVVKIFIIIALVKAIQAALAYEREGREQAEWQPNA